MSIGRPNLNFEQRSNWPNGALTASLIHGHKVDFSAIRSMLIPAMANRDEKSRLMYIYILTYREERKPLGWSVGQVNDAIHVFISVAIKDEEEDRSG